MKKLLVFMALLLLATPIATTYAEGVAGIGLGLDVKNVKDPGFAARLGVREQLTDYSYLQIMVNKLNYGNEVAVDNFGVEYIHFLGIASKWDLAIRGFGDSEVEGEHWGYGFGAEFDYFNIPIPPEIPFISSVIGDKFGAFTTIDLVHRPETNFYFQWNLGITFGK